MKTIVISNPTPIEGEIDRIHQLFSAGLEVMHIRKPDFSEKEYVDFIQQIDKQFHDRLVICSFHEAGMKLGFKRLHFTRAHYLKQIDFSDYENCILSTSTHSIEEFNELNARINYAFLSPIFESITKQGYVSERNLLEEVKYRTNMHTKLIALGGITEENKDLLMEKGFDGVGMMGTVWNI